MFIPGYELCVTIECRCLSSLISDIVGYNMLDPIEHPISWVWIRFNQRVFLGVVETIVGSLLCCCVDIVQCLFNLWYYVI